MLFWDHEVKFSFFVIIILLFGGMIQSVLQYLQF